MLTIENYKKVINDNYKGKHKKQVIAWVKNLINAAVIDELPGCIISKTGDGILHLICQYGNAILAKEVSDLLKEKSLYIRELTKPNSAGNTPLHMAARKGDLALLQALEPTDDMCLIQNEEGNNVLHMAIKSGNLEAATFILGLLGKRSVEGLMQRNKPEETSLFLAIKTDNVSLVNLILRELGDSAQKEVKRKCNYHYQTPLQVAITTENINMVLSILIVLGRDKIPAALLKQQKRRPGARALHLVTEVKDVASKKIIANVLLGMASPAEQKEMVLAKDYNQNTPIHLALAIGNTDLALIYLEILDPTERQNILMQPNANTKTPLQLAMDNGHFDTVSKIVARLRSGKLSDNFKVFMMREKIRKKMNTKKRLKEMYSFGFFSSVVQQQRKDLTMLSRSAIIVQM